MTFFKVWVWAGIPMMAVAVYGLVWFILRVIATVKAAHLFRVQPLESQHVRFNEAGRVVLSVEGPRFTRRFGGVRFELSTWAGEAVKGWPALLRARTSGFSTVRMEMMNFEIPRPGDYQLRMAGIGPPRIGDAQQSVVFMRPHAMRSIGYVVGIVFSASALIVSLVFFLLGVLGIDNG
jgi:hypothetical protein